MLLSVGSSNWWFQYKLMDVTTIGSTLKCHNVIRNITFGHGIWKFNTLNFSIVIFTSRLNMHGNYDIIHLMDMLCASHHSFWKLTPILQGLNIFKGMLEVW
jgi:hypothetical protein